ncbi:MAG: GuaB3 family IMP dehydrogenase-related protein [Chloroflexi bacterium]|nr:GuaB3 family IMP dehydrogenase-related protein [Chloroflexota bacterium]MQG05160.1 GuaB3 family IMP dehydrogenase-related protein [SAR202 cluster bacterium]
MDTNPKLRISNAYSFDDISIVPGTVTIDPDKVTTDFCIGSYKFSIPIIAAAMDAITSPNFIQKLNDLGGLGVMNLEGIQTRYKNPDETLKEIIDSSPLQATKVLQKLYTSPIKQELIKERINEIKSNGTTCAVSITPGKVNELAPIAIDSGIDILVIQSTVTTATYISDKESTLILSDLIKQSPIPVIVGNCVTYETAMELIEAGASGLLIGVGPGAACTTREVTGVGIPQVTATMNCSTARDDYFKKTGKYIPIITDGGIRTGGDMCKSLVSGADAVMLGTPLAQSSEAPGKGFNWGMASPHPDLPRGTRIDIGTKCSLKKLLFGPASVHNGTQNFIGALKVCMGMLGTKAIKEMHNSEIVISPSLKTEGKSYQIK